MREYLRKEKREKRKKRAKEKEKKMSKFSSFNFKALTGAFFIRGGSFIPSGGQFEARGYL